MRYVYSAILYLLLPLVVARFVWRSIREPAYRQRLGERLGWYSADLPGAAGPVLWVHAVSLGEVQAAVVLVRALLGRYPNHQLVVTTSTPAGSHQVRQLFGDQVIHVYVPWDLPGACRRFLARFQPRVLLLLETELWPNLITLSTWQGCRCLLVNARLSARSARRYACVPAFTSQVMQQLWHVCCQTSQDAERFARGGVLPAKLSVGGSLKYEASFDASLQQHAQRLRAEHALGERPVLLAASTHEGEEALLLQAFAQLRRQFPDLLLVLAPRRPERFAAVAGLCMAHGLDGTRRTSHCAVAAAHQVLLVDTLGELAAFFGLAHVAFIGGSLVPHGGHNPLEAALWSVPVISGPHVHNFADVYARLRAARAALEVTTAEQLALAVSELLTDDAARLARGRAGCLTVEENRGALSATMALLEQTLRN
ncbi:MAG: lipid IV(A) 3-deoxy-D-manno-octulosonic acid transferase [Gammaproteobacteria bacterium]|nr:lipid IV(A) 3-deoxy-D-manno-octulosonic acid transferase [Gammaproteobacteria bacterium]